MGLEGCKCLTPIEKMSLNNAFLFAKTHIQDKLKEYENDKESMGYRMINTNLTELENIKSRVKDTPDCY